MSGAVVRPSEEQAVSHLRALTARLRADGWHGELLCREDGHPYVRVINLAMMVLNDEITVEPVVPGEWWFHWSWGDRIARADHLDLAVARIALVLRGSVR